MIKIIEGVMCVVNENWKKFAKQYAISRSMIEKIKMDPQTKF